MVLLLKLIDLFTPTHPSTMLPSKSTCTLTFGDSAENHVGMEKLGDRVAAGEGFTFADLELIQSSLKDVTTELHSLHTVSSLPESVPPAYILIIRNGVDHLLGKGSALKLFEEQTGLEMDKKAFMYGRVVNKKARWNLCFDDTGHAPDYEHGKGRVVAYDDVPSLKALVSLLPTVFGKKAEHLKTEANYYYDITKCGIGWHGDTERRKVIAVRLGAAMPLCYQWYHRHAPVGPRIDLSVGHGDIYIMSEKAVGCDWKSSSIYTLRHAAGCESFTKVV
jgi:hypothetical protein